MAGVRELRFELHPLSPPLGFTHYWSRSKKGNWVVKRKTAGSRFRRSLKQIAQWCRRKRHLSHGEQYPTLWRKLKVTFSITA